MSEDLAIDIGFTRGSDEFQDFVVRVDNILERGCHYSKSTTDKMVEHCRRSNLDIARDVIDECQKKKKSLHSDNSKWWQKYTSVFSTAPTFERDRYKTPSPPVRRKHNGSNRHQRSQTTSRREGWPDPPVNAPNHTAFERGGDGRARNGRHYTRPHSPPHRRRKMNLTFEPDRGENQRDGNDNRYPESDEESDDSHQGEYRPRRPRNASHNNARNNNKRKRAMSPLFELGHGTSDVPEWPGRRGERRPRERRPSRSKRRR